MAVDYLSTLNAGSGLNTSEIIDALVNAERAPQENKITKARPAHGADFQPRSGQAGV